MRKLLLFIIGITIIALTVQPTLAARTSNDWNRKESGGQFYLVPKNATDHVGASADRIVKGWFTDLDATSATLGTIGFGFSTGSVIFADGSGNLDEDNANFFYTDATDVLTASGLTVSQEITANGGIDVVTGNDYQINNTSVLNATTLGSSVVNSSLTSLGTIASLVATTADIDGGTIDGTTIGGTTPAAATFTSSTATSYVIGANTLDTNEWAFLDGLDQALKINDNVTFANANITSTLTGVTVVGTTTLSGATITEGALGVPNTSDNLSFFSATTSSQLAGVISDETGTAGSLVFSNTPTLVTPDIGAATATSVAIGGNTLDTNEWANLDGIDQTVATISSPTFADVTVDNATWDADAITTTSTNNFGITATDAAMNMTVGTGAGDDFTINTTGFVYEGDTGKVGIGTATPSTKIHAFTNSGNAVIRTESSDTSGLGNITIAGDSKDIAIQQAGSTVGGTFAGLTQANLGLIEFADIGLIDTGTTKALHLGTNRTVAMTIDSSQNVGIGISSAIKKLHVKGDAWFANSTSDTAINITPGNPTTGVHLISSNHEGSGNLPLKLETGNGFVWIDDTGKVGIGTATPAKTLDVNGDIMLNGGSNTFFLGADDANSTGVSRTGNDLFLFTSNAEKMRITSAGNVGIGNSAPDRLLEISKSAGDSILELSTWSTTDTDKAYHIFQKSASSTINIPSPTTAGEDLGVIAARGVDTSTTARDAVQIIFEGGISPDADAVPGKMTIQTSDRTGLQTALTIDDSQDSTFAGHVIHSSTDTITAFAGGGQASAVLLTTDINIVTIVASAGDSVKLPAALAGMQITVVNSDTGNMDLFPNTGDFINGGAVNTAISVGTGQKAICSTADTSDWWCIVG